MIQERFHNPCFLLIPREKIRKKIFSDIFRGMEKEQLKEIA